MLQHVSLEVTRERAPACADFWELLGFRRVEPPPTLADRALWVERGRTQVHLLYADDPVAPPAGHTAVVVDDFAATFAALERAGLRPERRTEHWGAARAYVRSPAGHLVEQMASPPPGA